VQTRGFYGNGKLKLLFVVFALLVCNTAGGLASGLAGGLAFAAAAGLSALVQVTSFNGLDSAHENYLAFRYVMYAIKLVYATLYNE
jgi:hypothetical protein